MCWVTLLSIFVIKNIPWCGPIICLPYIYMLDHPGCILDRWSNNHRTVVQYLGRRQILDRLWNFVVFQFYQKLPGVDYFGETGWYRMMGFTRISQYAALEWIDMLRWSNIDRAPLYRNSISHLSPIGTYLDSRLNSIKTAITNSHTTRNRYCHWNYFRWDIDDVRKVSDDQCTDV